METTQSTKKVIEPTDVLFTEVSKSGVPIEVTVIRRGEQWIKARMVMKWGPLFQQQTAGNLR